MSKEEFDASAEPFKTKAEKCQFFFVKQDIEF